MTGNVSAGSNAHTISPGGSSTGTLTVGPLLISNLTTLDFSDFTSSSDRDKISTGTFNFSGTGTAAITIPASMAIPVGTYALVSYTGSTSITNISHFTISNPSPGYSLSVSGGGSSYALDLTFAHEHLAGNFQRKLDRRHQLDPKPGPERPRRSGLLRHRHRQRRQPGRDRWHGDRRPVDVPGHDELQHFRRGVDAELHVRQYHRQPATPRSPSRTVRPWPRRSPPRSHSPTPT